MTLVQEDDCGWLLDHEQFINDTYKTSGHRCMKDLFAITCPFMMDTQFAKLQAQELGPEEPIQSRKRKRISSLNHGEEALQENFKQIRTLLVNALHQLVELGRRLGTLGHKPKQYTDNNRSARQAAAMIQGCGDTMRQLASTVTVPPVHVHCQPLLLQDEEVNIVNRLVVNEDELREVKMLGGSYMIPANCSFLLSDIQHMEPLIHDEKKYDVIVLDPPWFNKSVKRKKTYNTLANEDLLKIPFNSLSKHDTLVVVWVTSKEQHQQFVMKTLFPAWNVTNVTKWYWLKVTQNGEPVYDMDSVHRKPYETLLLGRVQEPGLRFSAIPADKVVVSIPCSIHSRKPPLHEILKTLLGPNLTGLELFARNLQNGWTSWGNEVLYYQHTDFFEKENS